MKAVLWIFLALLVIAGGVGAWLYFNSGGLLRQAIEDYGTEALGSAVHVREVVMHWEQGAGEIRGVVVDQPEGYGTGPLLEIGTVRIGLQVDADTGRNNVVHLTEVMLAQARLHVIARGEKTNVEALSRQVEVRMGDTAGDTQPAGESRPLRLIIDRLALTDMRTHVESDVLGELDLKLPDVREQNLGKAAGGLEPAAIAIAIVRPLSESVTRELIRRGLDTDRLEEEARDLVRDKLDSELKRLTQRLKSGG